MLSSFKKFLLLSILILSFTSCASKTDGKYHTEYSYHPYYSLYATKMSNTVPKKKVITKSKKPKPKPKSKSKLSLINTSRFPNGSY
jgi:hypothetical protein